VPVSPGTADRSVLAMRTVTSRALRPAGSRASAAEPVTIAMSAEDVDPTAALLLAIGEELARERRENQRLRAEVERLRRLTGSCKCAQTDETKRAARDRDPSSFYRLHTPASTQAALAAAS
jgi:hypothetical protein